MVPLSNDPIRPPAHLDQHFFLTFKALITNDLQKNDWAKISQVVDNELLGCRPLIKIY